MVDKVIASRFENVLAKADKVLGNMQPGANFGDIADSLLIEEWRVQSMALLTSLFPQDHPYVVRFSKSCEPSWSDSNAVNAGKGVLIAAQEDFKSGYLWSLKERVHADVFDDFLEMAASLVKDGYKDAAAVIAGSTLEEHLRKLCQKHSIATQTQGRPKKASVMNDELHKQSVYPQNEWRAIQGWLDIRNDAAHGDYGKYVQQQVDLMIDGIRGFLIRNVA